jgi:hypothetical protein
MKGSFAGFVLCLLVFVASGQETTKQKKDAPKDPPVECPMHKAHLHGDKPSPAMNARGEEGMGFSQTSTTHHFLLKPAGGAIQVEANGPLDAVSRDNIRTHLKHIARAFSSGDFAIPMFVHDTVPPGVPEMKRLREKIKYSFEETPAGGRVVIQAADKESLEAIQKFLRFQIQEHKTGDPTELP